MIALEVRRWLFTYKRRPQRTRISIPHSPIHRLLYSSTASNEVRLPPVRLRRFCFVLQPLARRHSHRRFTANNHNVRLCHSRRYAATFSFRHTQMNAHHQISWKCRSGAGKSADRGRQHYCPGSRSRCEVRPQESYLCLVCIQCTTFG